MPRPTPDPLTTPLDLARAQRDLAAAAVGHTITYARSLPSTMPIAAAQIAEPGATSGLIVVAEEQTAGRGRQARSWVAAPGTALLVSIGLKPPHLRLPPTHLAMAAGLAAHAAAAELAPELAAQLTLKWPNDLLLGPPEQAGKLGGILIQTAFSPHGVLAHAVAGIGINANQRAGQLPAVAPPALPPVSLLLARGAPVDRTGLLIALCRALAATLDSAPHILLAAWRSRLSTLGQPVAVYAQSDDPNPILTGLAVDVDDDGALLVQDRQGRVHTVHAGDVSLRRAG